MNEPTYAIRVTATELHRLKMLADWQLTAAGIDPVSVNAAVREREDSFACAAVVPDGTPRPGKGRI